MGVTSGRGFGWRNVEVPWDLVFRQLHAGHPLPEVAKYTAGVTVDTLRLKAQREVPERYEEYQWLTERSRHASRRSKCGTNGGYNKHMRERTIPCTACCDAASAQQRDYRQRVAAKNWGYVVSHGTNSGYKKHITLKQRPCPECCQAHAEATAKWREKDRERRGWVRQRTPREPDCGTVSGYKRHVRRREVTCDPCRKAWRDETFRQRKAKRDAEAKLARKQAKALRKAINRRKRS